MARRLSRDNGGNLPPRPFLAQHNRMDLITITAGPFAFRARFEDALAPKTCARFRQLLPYEERIIHVRWSGEACWIPLGELDLGLGYENHTSFPAPGQVLLYRAGSARPRSCWATAPSALPARSANSPATTS